jgi:16S rRNA (adenine1518-N6/adenine1519-N6)-dimethyltransferase
MRRNKRKYGQHMLVDADILAFIMKSAGINQTESVCEVGTGTGFLTRELCKCAKSVISFEVDEVLFENTKKSLSFFSNLNLVNANVFKFSPFHFDVFVSNIPYSRSKDTLIWLSYRQFDRAIVMVQKEFMDKIEALSGQKNYRAISVITRYSFCLKRLLSVDRTSFNPMPRVDSEIVEMTPTNKPRLTTQTVRTLELIFSQRNRKLSVLAKRFRWKTEHLGNRRIDELDPHELVEIAESLFLKN